MKLILCKKNRHRIHDFLLDHPKDRCDADILLEFTPITL